jgi:hypothetical protein
MIVNTAGKGMIAISSMEMDLNGPCQMLTNPW